jgi:hypothetical protein
MSQRQTITAAFIRRSKAYAYAEQLRAEAIELRELNDVDMLVLAGELDDEADDIEAYSRGFA